MKNFKKLLVLIMFGLFVLSCGSRTTIFDISDEKQVAEWYEKGEWLQGCQLTPHESINQQAFAKEYFGNKELWDKTFEWLKSTDLNSLDPGRYIIEEGNSTATVSVAPAPEVVRWENHERFNDVQLVLDGRAQMGVAPISKAIVTEPYNERSDNGFFDVEEGEIYVAEPGMFLIFTPIDVHFAGAKFDVDTIKRLIIKVRAVNED